MSMFVRRDGTTPNITGNILPVGDHMNKKQRPSPIKYFHLRMYDEDEIVLPYGGSTVAYEYTEEGMNIAFAHCSMKDNYCKRVGREIAKKRLEEKSGFYFEIEGATCIEDMLEYITQLGVIDDDDMGVYEPEPVKDTTTQSTIEVIH